MCRELAEKRSSFKWLFFFLLFPQDLGRFRVEDRTARKHVDVCWEGQKDREIWKVDRVTDKKVRDVLHLFHYSWRLASCLTLEWGRDKRSEWRRREGWTEREGKKEEGANEKRIGSYNKERRGGKYERNLQKRKIVGSWMKNMGREYEMKWTGREKLDKPWDSLKVKKGDASK